MLKALLAEGRRRERPHQHPWDDDDDDDEGLNENENETSEGTNKIYDNHDDEEEGLDIVLDCLESWIGLPPTTTATTTVTPTTTTTTAITTTMEDDGPFTSSFYKALEQFLIKVWDPKTTSDIGGNGNGRGDEPYQKQQKYQDYYSPQLLPQHQQYQYFNSTTSVGSDDDNVAAADVVSSLYHAVLQIRVTRIVRYWMELNVRGDDDDDGGGGVDDDDDDDDNPLTVELLKYMTTTTALAAAPPTRTGSSLSSSTGRDDDRNQDHGQQQQQQQQQDHQPQPSFYPLIDALFTYVGQLPLVKSQINVYTQSLMQKTMTLTTGGGGGGGGGSTAAAAAAAAGTGSATTHQKRMEQLELWQQTSAKFAQEWDEHLVHLEYIVGEVYRLGSSSVRRQIRGHFGSVWTTFVSQNNSSSSSSSRIISRSLPFTR